MTSPTSDSFAQSIKQRLLNLSRRRDEPFNLVLVRFAIERMLYRLTRTPHSTQFVLKGAMLFAAWSGQPHRPTQDVDLLAFGPPEADRMASIFRAACLAAAEPDGIAFDPDSIVVDAIREEAVYDGFRVRLLARLGTAKIPVQIDIGFGDVVTPEPRFIAIDPMLDLPGPRILAYPPETVIAEKFEAMLSLGIANSRMKDFYDLWTMCRTMSFEYDTLRAAVHATASRRKTPLPSTLPVALSDRFSSDPSKQAQWNAFVGKLGDRGATPALRELVDSLTTFLMPLLETRDAHAGCRWLPPGPWHTSS